MRTLVIGFLFSAVLLSPVFGATIHVPSDQPTIQAGIDAAVDGDTVLVAPGTHSAAVTGEAFPITVNKCLFIIGSGAPEEVVVDAQSFFRVFQITLSRSNDSVEIRNLTVYRGDPFVSTDVGGGVYAEGPWIVKAINCVFRMNSAYKGAGVRASGLNNLILRDCSFVGNRICDQGGGVSLNNVASAVISRCYFLGDTANWGGGIHVYSGDTSIVIVDNVFEDCRAPHGGGIVCTGGATPIIAGNDFFNCDARFGDRYGGGAIDCEGAAPIIRENVISGCWGYEGAGIRLLNANAWVENNTIHANHGIGVYMSYSNPTFRDNIVSGSESHGVFNYAADSIYVSYCCLWENAAGDFFGPIRAGDRLLFSDPRFCDTLSSDYSVSESSPCISAGFEGDSIGALGVGCASYLGPVWYVDAGGSDTTGDGSADNPFRTVRRAVDATANGDTVLIGAGLYSGAGNRDIGMPGHAIVVAGIGSADGVVLDGEGQFTLFVFPESSDTVLVDSTTVLKNMTLTNATTAVVLSRSAPKLADLRITSCSNACVFTGFSKRLESADADTPAELEQGDTGRQTEVAIIRNCSFERSEKGIHHYSSSIDLRIEDCVFDSCITCGIERETPSPPFICKRTLFRKCGFGILKSYYYAASSHVVIDSCQFEDNTTAVFDAAVITNSHVSGGNTGFRFLFYSPPPGNRVENCIIENTESYGIYISETVTPIEILNTRILNNLGYALWIRGDGEDGAATGYMYGCRIEGNTLGISAIDRPRLTMERCEYIRNSAPIHISSWFDDNAFLNIKASTLAMNPEVAIEIGPQSYYNIAVAIDSTLVAFNGGVAVDVRSDASHILLTSRCSDYFANDSGNFAGTDDQVGISGNFSADPFFCDTATGDYTIRDISPCAPEFSTCGSLVGALGIGCYDAVPVVTSPDSVVVGEDSLLVVHVTYEDADGPDTVVTVEGLPSWLVWDVDSVFGTPTEGIGDTTFSVIVSDGYRADTLVVGVYVMPVNDPPEWIAVGPQALLEGELLELAVAATDPENGPFALTVVNPPLPSNAAFTDSGNGRGLLTFDPDFTQSGQYEILLEVSDGEYADSLLVSVTVNDANGTINSVAVAGEAAAWHVTEHAPTLAWSYVDPLDLKAQTQYEVAVGNDNDWAYAEMWNPAPVVAVDTSVTYAGAGLIDGATYYLRLRVHNGVAWSEWFYSSFRMNSLPGVPVASGPMDEVVVGTAQPGLWVQNSADAEGDTVVYDFFVVVDTLFGEPNPIEAFGVAGGSDSTGWAVPVALQENARYFWKARAFDGYEYSEWTEPASFWVNGVEESPGTPSLAGPEAEGCCLTEMMPQFVWSRCDDPDPVDTVRYRVHIAVDPAFEFASVTGLLADTNYVRPDSLEFGEQYWWKVTAEDRTGLTAESEVTTFWTWMPGDVDNSHALSVADLTYLIAFLFRGGEGPCDALLSDIDGSCVTSVADLTYLIAHLFRGGPAPVACG